MRGYHAAQRAYDAMMPPESDDGPCPTCGEDSPGWDDDAEQYTECEDCALADEDLDALEGRR